MTRPRIFGAALALGAAVLAGCGGPPEQQAPPPPAVEVATPVRRDVTSYYHYTGNLEAVASVEVRARVSGRLEAKLFENSTPVTAGQPLFTIETEPYDIGIAAAEAAVKSAEAGVELATLEKSQVREAFDKNAANERELQKYITALKTAEAQLLSAQAQLRDAKLQRSYADVVSPIDGQIDEDFVDVGNLVGVGEPTLLTTVEQMDPVYVYIDVSSTIVEEYLNRRNTGEANRGEDVEPPPIEVHRDSDPDGQYPFVGQLDYVANVMDEGTGTLLVRGIIPNPDRLLRPGMYVNARVPYDTIENAVLVREDALGTDLTSKFVLVLDDKNIVEKRPVTVGERQGGGLIVVTSGLDGSERYVTVGTQKARPGAPVTIRPPKAAPAPTPNPPASADASGGDAPAEKE